MMRATLQWMTLFLLILAPLGLHAACRFSSGGNTSVTFSGLPSTISVAANTPNNTVLATSGQASPANPPTIECGYYFFGIWIQSAETITFGVSNALGGYQSDNITYDTGVPGVGYRITHPSAYLKPYPLDSQSLSSSNFSVTSGIELIKTGPITSGTTLAVGKLADWQWGSLIPETFRLANSITFTTPSCTIVTNPIDVVLPNVLSSAFTGVGSTSGKKPFQIQLSCPTGTAVKKIMLQTAFADSHTGVVAPSTGPGFAQGIGVQILDGNSNAVTFNVQAAVTPNATTSIPYYAQYFQTAPAVSSGAVKATVTFDVYYQ
ncbi:MAG: fimbrial protein [Rhodanobacter sp.]